jgi:hypothetical protein
MTLFDTDKVTADTEHFERYFISALKKRCSSLKRRTFTKKKKKEKYAIPFSLKQHDIPDDRIVPVEDECANYDVVRYCSECLKDHGVIELLYEDYSVKETCEKLKISPQKYRAIVKRVRSNSHIQRVFSSN